MSSYKYDAFVSYKHATERSFAVDLELHLKRYSRGFLSRPRKIFRDEQHLRLGHDLPLMIEDALLQSKFLVLLASPEAANSPWVEDEIKIWCGELQRTDRLIIILTQGNISVRDQQIDWGRTDALPPNLQHYLKKLPLWVDLSKAREPPQRDLSNPAYKSAINAIVARFENVEPNDLLGEEWRLRRRNRTIALVTAMTLLMLLVMSIVAGIQLASRNQQLTEALDISRSRELGASARLVSAPEALKLSAEAVSTAKTNEAINSLRDTLSRFRALRGHQAKAPDAIESMAATPSGDILFSPSQTGGVAKISQNGGSLQSFDVPNGSKIVGFKYVLGKIVARTSGGIWLYEMENQKWLQLNVPTTVSGTDWPPSAISVDADGDTIILGWSNGHLGRLEIETGKTVLLAKHAGQVTAIAQHGDSVFSAAATSTDPVRVTSLSTGTSLIVSGAETAVNDLVISRDGKRLALAFEIGGVAVLSLPQNELVWKNRTKYSTSSLAFSENNDFLAVGDSAGNVYVFDKTGSLSDEFEAVIGGVWELDWQDQKLLSAGTDGWIRVWDPITPGPVSKSLPNAELLSWVGDTLFGFNSNFSWSLRDQEISKFKYPFGQIEIASKGVLLAQMNKTIMLHSVGKNWDIKSYSFQFDADKFHARSFAVSPDGSTVAVSLWPKDWSKDKSEVMLWRWSKKQIEKLQNNLRAPDAMAFLDARRLAVASNGNVAVWDIDKYPAKATSSMSMSSSPINSLAFLDAKTLALGNLMGFIEVRDLDSPEDIVARSEQVVGAVNQVKVLRKLSKNDKAELLILTLDVDGVKVFDRNLVLRGSLLDTKNRQVGVRTINPDISGNLIALTLQGGQSVLVPASIASWEQAARNRAKPHQFHSK